MGGCQRALKWEFKLSISPKQNTKDPEKLRCGRTVLSTETQSPWRTQRNDTYVSMNWFNRKKTKPNRLCGEILPSKSWSLIANNITYIHIPEYITNIQSILYNICIALCKVNSGKLRYILFATADESLFSTLEAVVWQKKTKNKTPVQGPHSCIFCSFQPHCQGFPQHMKLLSVHCFSSRSTSSSNKPT